MSQSIKSLKSVLRSSARMQRDALSLNQRERASREICQLVEQHSVIQAAKSVALYWPMGSEVDIRPLWSAWPGKHIYAPFMTKSLASQVQLGFQRVSDEKQLRRKEYGFRQPPLGLPVAQRGEIDVMIVPALLLSLEGQRLGYGAGFYDRLIAAFKPQVQSLFLGFESQIVNDLPVEAHDHHADFLLTEARSVHF